MLKLNWRWLLRPATQVTYAAIAAEVVTLSLMTLEWHVRPPQTIIAAVALGCGVMIVHYHETKLKGR